MDIDELILFGSLFGLGLVFLDRNRLFSESSCKSWLSFMILDSEDGY